MYDEPEQRRGEPARDPQARAREKADEMALHAELAAVFEGPRKTDAEVSAALDADVARGVQRTVARLEKSKAEQGPILPPAVAADAVALLEYPLTHDLSTNDYHVYRRPGEAMILRWLAGGEVETFHERFQAHFEAAFDGFRRDERSANEWRGDETVNAYLDALDAVERKTADGYLRGPLRQHAVIALSTLTVDEMDVLHLCDGLMGVPAAAVVGRRSAPPDDDPADRDRAWFFKLFSLRAARATRDGVERMCFFTFLQKTDDGFDL